jgi:RNA polymerase sigma-70 factor (ECF subfamily)
MPERPLEPDRLATHLDRLYRAALALCGSREDAEDLVQETYARVLAKPRFLRRQDDLPYLLGTLHHTFVSQLRARQRRPRSSPVAQQAEPIDARGSANPHDAAEAELLYALIAGLPQEFRVVLVAVDIVGLSYREVARHIGIPEATVASRLFRARQRVARELVGDRATGAPGPERDQRSGRHVRS